MTALLGREQLEISIKQLTSDNETLKRALGDMAAELLRLANSWRLRYPDSDEERQRELMDVGGDLMTTEDFVREEVYLACAEQLEALEALRLEKVVRGERALEGRQQAWRLAEQRLPVMYPFKACIRNANQSLEDAVREQDGTEHPAIWQLTEVCKWLLTAIDASKGRE